MNKFKLGDRVIVDTGFTAKSEGVIVIIDNTQTDFPYRVHLKSLDQAFWCMEEELELEHCKEDVKKGMDGGGLRFNEDKPRLELLVPEALEAEARVWAIGAKKYGEYNWQRGMPWMTVLGCLLRHTFAILRGEDIDKESGELHAAHIKCNATMLIYYYHNYKQGDNRTQLKESK